MEREAFLCGMAYKQLDVAEIMIDASSSVWKDLGIVKLQSVCVTGIYIRVSVERKYPAVIRWFQM